MKIRKYIKVEENPNQDERIDMAWNILFEQHCKDPLRRHEITVELNDGKLCELYINPRFVPVYTA